MKNKEQYIPPKEELWFLPLGGSGEIGMNLNLYGTAGKWLMVDCGISFPDETTPGVEVIMPDIQFISERRRGLLGIVITHGHEDHIGAIEYLWPQLQCPIYTTKFTAEILRAKFGRREDRRNVEIVELPVGGGLEIGPFKVDLIHVTHSIPETHMLAIETEHGKVLHTGDWKFDPNPGLGDLTDFDALKELGKQKILAIVGDSTNALTSGHSASEVDARKGLAEVFDRCKHRIVVTCFASNIARIKSVCYAARVHGRHVALVGRSLWRNAEIAHACGYFPEFTQLLSEDEAMQAPRDKIVMVCTGCQGEGRAALSRIANEDHPEVELDEGDTVIFSSRDIPGNEKAIARVQNLLLTQGLQIVTADNAPVHASGHPSQDEVAELYKIVKPRLAVPVHGELRHQSEHARIAEDCGIIDSIIPSNGQIIRLAPGEVDVIGEVQFGKIGLDGKVLRRLNGEAIKHRRKIGFNGVAVITLVLNRRDQLLSDPQITLLGLEDDDNVDQLRYNLIEAVINSIERMNRGSLSDDQAVKSSVVQAARRLLNEAYGKRPVMEVNIMRV